MNLSADEFMSLSNQLSDRDVRSAELELQLQQTKERLAMKEAENFMSHIHDINLLNEDFIRRDVVWFTDKSKEGSTQVKRLSSLGLHKTMNPYNAYKQGKLVDLPFLGSIYLETE